VRGPVPIAAIILGLLVAIAVAYSAGKTVRSEEQTFHPPRRVPPRPDGVAAEDVAFRDGSGVELKGWWVPSKNGAAVILTHGSAADRGQLDQAVRLLAGAGFGVLAFDWPGCGESGGEVKLGSPERAAFRAAVDWALRQGGVQPGRVGTYGVSIGGALVTAFSADDPRVRAVAAAGAFTDAVEQTRYEYGQAWPWSRAAAGWVVRRETEGGNLRPIEGAPRLRDRRTLFVSFEADPVVPASMSDELAKATGGEVYRVPGEGHGTYLEAGGSAYAAKLVEFFSSALLAQHGGSGQP
jgi:uncharacterized protein